MRKPHRADTRRARALAALVLVAGVTLGAPVAHAALQDEIQVYADEINAPGEFGAELHVNTTPRGNAAPAYPGEVVNHRGLRITPELSWGLTRDLEAGLYLPLVRDGTGQWSAAGVKARLKWLPIRPAEGSAGFFAGANVEFSRVAQKFSQSQNSLELRTMVGWRDPEWLLAANPTLGWDLSPGFRGAPDFSLGLKASRKVTTDVALGVEYYAGMGKINRLLPGDQQERTLFLTVDYEGKPVAFNFGIGRGLTSAADAWTLKAIIDLPF
jgi:hypothetical protein